MRASFVNGPRGAKGLLSADGAMRGLARLRLAGRRRWIALPLLCTLVLVSGSGCSLDFLYISFCASEFQGISTIDGSPGFTSAQGGVSVVVGDSVRLRAHGICRDAGLHVVIASGTQWHSHDGSIVRLSPAPDMSDGPAGTMATAWAVGLTPGSAVVSGDLGESLASVTVTVLAR